MTTLLDLLKGILLLSDEDFEKYKSEISTIRASNPEAYNIACSLINIRVKCK